MYGQSAKYDVAIIGAGPTGAFAAIQYARKGAQVLLLEAAPGAKHRLAGEWLHPRAVRNLEEVGIDLEGTGPSYPTGTGFVVLPDDGSEPIVLPYSDEARGHSLEHFVLVDAIREAAMAHPKIEYVEHARATDIRGQRLTYQVRGRAGERRVPVGTIVGADGRTSVARRAVGLENVHTTYSRMAGLVVQGKLPEEGFGHVLLGGPGPILAYRIAPDAIRICIDVPMEIPYPEDKVAFLWDGYAHILPESLRPSFRETLAAGQVAWAKNQLRARTHFGREGLILIGDSVGHYHPMTALGMTLGLDDARRLAELNDFDAFRKARRKETRVAEMLAVALYEVFSEGSDEMIAMRTEIYEMWRRSAAERRRTMRFLSADEVRTSLFTYEFFKVAGLASRSLVSETLKTGHWRLAADMVRRMGTRTRWLGAGALEQNWERTSGYRLKQEDATRKYRWPRVPAPTEPRPRRESAMELHEVRRVQNPSGALEAAVSNLTGRQAEDGWWEGEVCWGPLLAAQYVIVCHATGTEIPRERRARLLRHFADTRDQHGTWGLHELSEAYLLVTTLVYAAARLLGVERDDPLIDEAARFIRGQGVVNIPTWGKLWLAILNVYDWSGIYPILPEAWRMPRWLPMHPSRYGSHVRQAYGAMAYVYGRRFQVPFSAVVKQLRAELYPEGYEQTLFQGARSALRPEEAVTSPNRLLNLLYDGAALVDRVAGPRMRESVMEELMERIRFELRSTRYASISPVSGLLGMLAVWLHDPRSQDVARALEGFETWIWEDDQDGLRIAAARSRTLDTALSLQALSAAREHVDVRDTLASAARWLQSQQIDTAAEGYEENYRIDPRGGFCLGQASHGWPMSDVTAEALLALLRAPGVSVEKSRVELATRFILRCQNADGGFGSYEARRIPFSMEWMNPTELFEGAMSEGSSVEHTAACITALAEVRRCYPELLRVEVDQAMERGAERLRTLQRADGGFEGRWGICFVYGTSAGLRGLLAAGLPPQSAPVRKACLWLVERQRDDGGWGEHYSTCRTRQYTEHYESNATQTGWALAALLEASEPNQECIDRAARYLARSQRDEGEWPRQDPVGVFYRTAVVDYAMYRTYFPARALALYEARMKTRLSRKEATGAGRASA